MFNLIVTVGPSSISKDCLLALYENGADCFRINLSHSNEDLLSQYYGRLSELKLPIALDTEGAQLRTVDPLFDGSTVDVGQLVQVYLDFGSTANARFNQADLTIASPISEFLIEPDDKIRVDSNGLILQVTHKLDDNLLETTVISAGSAGKRKAVDVLDKPLESNMLTLFDEYALQFAKDNSITTIFSSFTSNSREIVDIHKRCAKGTKIIAKIESIAGLINMEEIVNCADGVLIDRGDPSREISLKFIPLAQEAVINYCNKESVPVYVATNILETMIKENLPTRAEVCDIYSLLKMDVTGLVLAAETAIGHNPIGVTQMVKSIQNLYNLQSNSLTFLHQYVPTSKFDSSILGVWMGR
ncbi:hypothetical protein CMK12_03215 [Candidatus Poribacteria bacterium]|jgi:pyruvate kinase|nr:hypothetical protein [Candidatus Poribacteria bacterium]MDP6594958.1 pyruvate kinase [Candidatus Poribacteria bacterium]MDP6751206.1 pyruvate kinase [Candidatus Poribacteria bacterium]MDP6999677.1 pyruvate kinase [Candidatus Poribacteria bacterium]